MSPSTARIALFVAACLGIAARAEAQLVPGGPITVADGRVAISGDISATYGSADPGFFQYTDYEHSLLRMLRVNVAAAVTANRHFSILADIQTENFDSVRPYALYARIRPWLSRPIDIQVGRVPPTFGAFGRRSYVADNPLIGYPLGYQYLTSLRPDSLPADANELLQKRGLGWLLRYSVGSNALDHGVPLIDALRWDTGVQVHASFLENGKLNTTASVTTGTLSNPRVTEDNAGKQVAARADFRPATGLILGTSFARGAFVADSAVRSAIADGKLTGSADLTQAAWGADVEYSRDYYLIRAETIYSSWHLPVLGQPAIAVPLRSSATSVEGRYTISPALYVATRVGHLWFGDVAGSTVTEPFDAPVTRLEVGGGYRVQRNVLAKVSYFYNHRDGGRLVQTANQVAGQIVYWF